MGVDWGQNYLSLLTTRIRQIQRLTGLSNQPSWADTLTASTVLVAAMLTVLVVTIT